MRRKSSKVDVRDYPAQVVIAGAVGKTANDGNGVFIRTKEDMNGCALYIKAVRERNTPEINSPFSPPYSQLGLNAKTD